MTKVLPVSGPGRARALRSCARRPGGASPKASRCAADRRYSRTAPRNHLADPFDRGELARPAPRRCASMDPKASAKSRAAVAPTWRMPKPYEQPIDGAILGGVDGLEQVVDRFVLEERQLGDVARPSRKKISPGSAMSSRSRSSAAVRSPRCAMSIAPREPKCTMRPSACAGQSRFMQRATASPSGRTIGRAARRALGRHDELALLAGAQAGDGGDHLGDHLARAPHDNRVADQHPFALDLVGVVQRGHRYGHAAHAHRLEHRERRHRARAPHAHHDVLRLRRLLLGRELVGDGPAGNFDVLPSSFRSPNASTLMTAPSISCSSAWRRSRMSLDVGFDVVDRGARLGLGVHAQADLTQVLERLRVRSASSLPSIRTRPWK